MGAGGGSAEPGAVPDPSGNIPFNLTHPRLIPQEGAQGCFLRLMQPRVSQGRAAVAARGVVLHPRPPQPVPPGPGCSRVFLTDLFLLI